MLANLSEDILTSSSADKDVIDEFNSAVQSPGKPFFTWLRSTSKTSPSPSPPSSPPLALSDSSSSPSLEPAAIANDSPSESSLSSFREFRGVQSLKHLWNNRISAIKDTEISSHRLDLKTKNRTKSYGCLVTASNSVVGEESTRALPERNCRLRAQTKRAQSLHDCTNIDDPSSSSSHESDNYNEIDLDHREKDNFYKYKTAAQARDTILPLAAQLPAKKLFAGGNFPAIGASDKGERIHWMKREDIVKRSGSIDNADTEDMSQKTLANICPLPPDDDDDDINVSPEATTFLSLPSAADDVRCRQTTDMLSLTDKSNYSDTDTITRTNSSSNSDSPQRNNSGASSLPFGNSSNSLRSVRSAGDILSAGRPRKNVNSSRKYSFKTHAKNYHSPRKMYSTSASKQDGSAATSAAGSSGSSLVAKLTQQFNEIIQKDKKLLNEVKRKNGILMSRGGHVYKVIERTTQNSPRVSIHTTNLQSSTTASTCAAAGGGSTVQQNIKKFESGAGEKPKIPSKSIHVMRKRKELTVVIGNRQAVDLNHNSSTIVVKQQPQTVQHKRAKTSKEGQPREIKLLELKPQMVLEEIQEETRTPQDVEEKLLIVDYDELESLEPANDPHKPTGEEAVEVSKSNCSSPIDSKSYSNNDKQTKMFSTKDKANVSIGCDSTEEFFKAPRQPPEGQEDQPINKDTVFLTGNSYKELLEEEEARIDNSIRIEDTEDSQQNDEATSDEMKLQQRKHKYAKIYEKFRFRSPFGKGGEEKITLGGAATFTKPPKTDIVVVDFQTDEFLSPKLFPSHLEPEAKILDALEEVDRKIKGLSNGSLFVLSESSDFEQLITPNDSFVFQLNSKNASDKAANQTDDDMAQAVNAALISTIDDLKQKESERCEKATSSVDQPCFEPLPSVPIEFSPTQQSVLTPDSSKEAAQIKEEIYEPIESKKSTKSFTDLQNEEDIFPSSQISFLFKTRTPPTPCTSAEVIYQTLEELAEKEAHASVKTQILDDYESIAGSCEQTLFDSSTPTLASPSPADDGYEICEPPPSPPTAPVVSRRSDADLQAPLPVRNTTDELPELPKPKRILPKSPVLKSSASSPPIPVKRNTSPDAVTVVAVVADVHDHHYYADDENIYDTIKGSHCYESLQSGCNNNNNKQSLPVGGGHNSLDSVSLTSNCYESITNYRRAPPVPRPSSIIALRKAGSTSTISSDHKTNSLYEVSMPPGLLNGGVASRCGSSIGGNNSSTHASSDNSDEWVDISDAEVNSSDVTEAAKQKQFIVVRERSKPHRSPDWSKRVRDKRLHQKTMSCIDDDSDHYYEPLFPLGNKRHSSYATTERRSHHKRNQDLPTYVPKNKNYLSFSRGGSNNGASDDYDSFDTDIDDVYEPDDNWKNNDSGVDIRNLKQLPEPPHTTNQVYAFVRKFKNFISSKKSSGSVVQKLGGNQKIYENSTQFYVDGNLYQNTPKASHKTKPPAKVAAKALTPPKDDDDAYENTDFHNPPTIGDSSTLTKLSSSEKNLLAAGSNDLTLRSKSKTGKSFKSRLRKSLAGTTFDTKHLTGGSLITTRSTFYISDTALNAGSGELDSGFSEKTGEVNGENVAQQPAEECERFLTGVRKSKKETNASNAHRRRTTIGVRPNDPPPPPPPSASTPENQKTQKHHSTSTSWYAECGVFKSGVATTANAMNEENSGKSSTLNGNTSTSSSGGGASWYTEAGLYQTSDVSVASSSGSSGVSTGNEAGPGDDMLHSMFLNEPLYQIYSAAKLESISRDMEDHDGSTDGYEEIGQNEDPTSVERQKCARPSALQLVGPKYGPSRTLWSEIPEVINSGILPTLTPRERGLQEAKFEVLTSEASYLKSLNLLRSHFMNHPVFRDTAIVSARDRKALFSYIVPVHECSERLLCQLESCWQDNIMLLGLSKSIYANAEKHFHVYISFCEHQGRVDRTLRRLKEAKGTFSQNLDLLESSPICCGLNLHSFLMLPMQRITRLPLLIDAVFSKVSPNDDEYDNWKMTLAIMNKIVAQCNEAANRCEQAYEIERISRQLEFPSSIRALAIAPVGVPAQGSKPRFLVKKGELTHLIWRGDDAKLTFGKKFSKSNIFAFLFSDLLVLTKRKAEEQFLVFDYCQRSMLTISSGDVLPQLPTKDISQTGKNLILMTLLENNEKKTIELVLSCPSVSEQERWLQAMRPPEAETPGEKLYEQWDCPQVTANHVYEANEPDLLSLEIGDVINVSRKLPDGWYQGERIRDGAVGWFPGNFTEEVNSAHVRARNLKQRYRLLTFTASYLESQKRK